MSDPDDLETTLADRFASYRPAARELFPPPPSDAVHTRARARTIRQRTTVTLAAAAAAIIAVAIGLTVVRGNHTPAPLVDPEPSRSATPQPSTDAPTPTASTSGGTRPPSSTRSSGTPNQTGPAITVRLSPATVAPGGRLDVAAECGFPPHTATADSTAFGHIDLDRYEAGFQSGTATVRSTIRPGTYTVTARCADGRTGRATLTVS